jgi:hypothetical protein
MLGDAETKREPRYEHVLSAAQAGVDKDSDPPMTTRERFLNAGKRVYGWSEPAARDVT